MDLITHMYQPYFQRKNFFFLFSLFFPWTFHELYYLYDLGQIVIFFNFITVPIIHSTYSIDLLTLI